MLVISREIGWQTWTIFDIEKLSRSTHINPQIGMFQTASSRTSKFWTFVTHWRLFGGYLTKSWGVIMGLFWHFCKGAISKSLAENSEVHHAPWCKKVLPISPPPCQSWFRSCTIVLCPSRGGDVFQLRDVANSVSQVQSFIYQMATKTSCSNSNPALNSATRWKRYNRKMFGT